MKTSPKRIFIVDDNVDAANSLAVLLAFDGHTTQIAYHGKQALEQLPTFSPGIALLDIGLPEMGGYELAARLRALPSLSELHLIALTGYGQAEDRQCAQVAGFDDHLTKPVEFSILQQAVAKS